LGQIKPEGFEGEQYGVLHQEIQNKANKRKLNAVV